MQNSKYNIVFVYEYSNESWSTPYSLMREFSTRGHNVVRHHLTNINVSNIVDSNPDILIVLDWKGIDIPDSVHDALNPSCYKIRECADTPQNYEAHLPYIKKYNLLLTPDYESCKKYKKASGSCIWFNHFADSSIHHPYDGNDNYPPVRSTRGQGGSELMDYLSATIPDKFINKNGLVGEEYGKFLGLSSIVLQNSRWKEITRRLFEGMACGKLVLTDRLPKETRIDYLFKENIDIVYYDNISDLVSKINYYLSPEGAIDRKYIAKNGYNKVMREHTQVNRVDDILNWYEIWKKDSL